MSRFKSLRAKLVGAVFVAIAPAWFLVYYAHLPWPGVILSFLALMAAWFGGERFILAQARVLLKTTRSLGIKGGSQRTGLGEEKGPLGDLARRFDELAEKLETRAHETEAVEETLLNRSLQQTVISVLGQFALSSNDFQGLLSQACMLVNQTLEVEFCHFLQLLPDGKTLRMRSGLGWRPGLVGELVIPIDEATEAGFAIKTGEPAVLGEPRSKKLFGTSRFLAQHGVCAGITVPVSGDGTLFGVLGAHTARKRQFTGDEVNFLLALGSLVGMAAARAKAEVKVQKLAVFAQLNPNPAMELAADGTLTYFNDAALQLANSVQEDSPARLLPEDVGDIVRDCLATRDSKVLRETVFRNRTLSWSFHPVIASQVVHAYVEDITERLSLQAQLLHSQKMESVGQLAAGVAHDFNNMLTVVQGHAGMLLARSSLPGELRDSVQAISFASERAANLTRQLLMFSRKKIIQPKPLDVRELVAQMSKMLHRLLGESITLTVEGGDKLPMVQADAGMLEQVLMNLAVNARDAMPKGGTLTISTYQTDVTADYAATHPEARTGLFVCLRVSDTGCGMDAATKAHVFEPFFTTKEVGKGTGLGLATVYGIVKQHEGWIELESEPGKGTTFRVFVPALAEAQALPGRAEPPELRLRGGDETILVVEDEPILRSLASAILEDFGYQVLEAGSGPEALQVWDQHQNSIDLLLTDMVMPEGISGMELAQRLQSKNPRLKIVLATGYSVEEMDTDFLSRTNAMFIQKPYTHISLAKSVRQCLDK